MKFSSPAWYPCRLKIYLNSYLRYCWPFWNIFISTGGTSPGMFIFTKDSGNERIRAGQKIPENLSSKLWKTKKLEHFETDLFFCDFGFSVFFSVFDSRFFSRFFTLCFSYDKKPRKKPRIFQNQKPRKPEKKPVKKRSGTGCPMWLKIIQNMRNRRISMSTCGLKKNLVEKFLLKFFLEHFCQKNTLFF